MATLVAEMMLRGVLEGSLSLNDMEIKHQPSHGTRGCALHKSKSTCPSARRTIFRKERNQ
ncbi:hypothetical protein ACJRO7_013523 [Eucalyptus globulus]|uniref:Uncharacterized protein n=1 Tax=Eucalyptus globulus TaxID=34317 RepID=A0ABD3L167_EUCGL